MPKCRASAAGTSASSSTASSRRPCVVVMRRVPRRVTRPVGVSRETTGPRVKWLSRRRLLPHVAGLEVRERVRRGREDELRAPLPAVRALAVVPVVPLAHQADVLAPLVRHHAVAQRQRLDEAVTEADIGQHRPVERGRGDDERQVVEGVGEPAVRGRDARRDEVDGIPQVAQERGEEAVELVAVAAAAGVDDLRRAARPRSSRIGRPSEMSRVSNGTAIRWVRCSDARRRQRRRLGCGDAEAGEVGGGLRRRSERLWSSMRSRAHAATSGALEVKRSAPPSRAAAEAGA